MDRPDSAILVVDDNDDNRYALCRRLEREGYGHYEIAENGRIALERLAARPFDLVLLDIQMPELDGLEVVREVGAARMPAIIFVTAYDEHALAAFEVHALDYLLKPVDPDRLAAALARAASMRRAGPDARLEQRLLAWLEQLASRTAAGRLALRVQGSTMFVKPEEIDWLEAHNNHVRVHAGQRTLQVRETLTNLLGRLPTGRFLRVHRSAVVNIERIREIQPWFAGDYVLILLDGTRITSGRSFRREMRHFLEHTV
jgi:two-component system LytT family response regulator